MQKVRSIFKLIVLGMPIGIWYYHRDTIWNLAVSALAKQAKLIIKSELNKEALIDLCSSNFNQVVHTYVLDNVLVTRRTSELFNILFETESFKILSNDLIKLALQQPAVQSVISESLLEKTVLVTRDECIHLESLKVLQQELSKIVI